MFRRVRNLDKNDPEGFEIRLAHQLSKEGERLVNEEIAWAYEALIPSLDHYQSIS